MSFYHSVITKYQIEAGISPILFHYTSIYNAATILNEDKFRLSTFLGTQADQKDTKGKFYFLSTSRVKNGGFQRKQFDGVSLVLDGKKLEQKFKGISVDYWGPSWRKAALERGDMFQFLTYDENEDRILSNQPEIENASKYILELHVFVIAKTESAAFYGRYMQNLRKLALDAKKKRLPIFFYEDLNNWKIQNKNKAKTFSELGIDWNRKENNKGYTQIASDYFDKYLELYHAKNWDNLSKDAKNVIYYDYEQDRVLEADIHNHKNDPLYQKQIASIVQIMKKHKLKTIKEFIKLLVERAKKLKS